MMGHLPTRLKKNIRQKNKKNYEKRKNRRKRDYSEDYSIRRGGKVMPKRICDACGKEKDVYGGKVCSKGHFICQACYMSRGSTKCPLCGTPLR